MKVKRRHPLTFDGNHSDRITNWLFPVPDKWDGMTEDALDDLMRATVSGNLHWCVFTPAGYRL